jgi:hypothetical protein
LRQERSTGKKKSNDPLLKAIYNENPPCKNEWSKIVYDNNDPFVD